MSFRPGRFIGSNILITRGRILSSFHLETGMSHWLTGHFILVSSRSLDMKILIITIKIAKNMNKQNFNEHSIIEKTW